MLFACVTCLCRFGLVFSFTSYFGLAEIWVWYRANVEWNIWSGKMGFEEGTDKCAG